MSFNRFHPAVEAAFFISVLCGISLITEPVFAAVSVLGAFLLCVVISGVKAFKYLKFIGFTAVLVTFTNPLFSHKGKTVLFFLAGNPITLEAFIYGALLGVTLCGVLLWCKALSQIFTSDKYLILLSKPFPKTALVLSSSLRFLPLLSRRAKEVMAARRALGLSSSVNLIDRVKGTLDAFVSLWGWSLEHAVESSRSMLSRGYGLRKRSRYIERKFTFSDMLALLILFLLDAVVLSGAFCGVYTFSCYPQVRMPQLDLHLLAAYISFSLLCLLPFILYLQEVITWHFYRSKI